MFLNCMLLMPGVHDGETAANHGRESVYFSAAHAQNLHVQGILFCDHHGLLFGVPSALPRKVVLQIWVPGLEEIESTNHIKHDLK